MTNATNHERKGMTMYTTIRKNATKKITAILNAAILIREQRYDDMGDTNAVVTPERVLECGRQFEFDRVYVDDSGSMRACIHQNWSFVAYPSIEVARNELTPQAFAKYFPTLAVA